MIKTQKFKTPKIQWLLAESEEAAAVAPHVVGLAPVQVQDPPGSSPGEVGHAAAATREHPAGAEGDDLEPPLFIRVPGPEGEQVLDLRCNEAERFEALLDLLGRCAPGEVEEAELGVHRTLALDQEVFGRNTLILPVVLAERDHDAERHRVIDAHRKTIVLEGLVVVPEERLEVLGRDLTLFHKAKEVLHLTERRSGHGYFL